MKDKRIWIIIGCILFLGCAVTLYTRAYIDSRPDAAESAAMTSLAETSLPQQEKIRISNKETTKEAETAETEDAVSETITPLSRENAREESEGSDYTQRLKELDAQLKKLRSEERETDASAYTIKTSAETELKLWESEMNLIYNGMLEALPETEGQALIQEQQDWLKLRESQAAENSQKSGNSVESVGYTTALVKLTKARAFELAERFETISEPQKEGPES
jgi:uncharacterized protein YecT (DUF1311 family)